MYYSSWLLRLAIINNHYTQISALLESYRRHPDDIFDIFLCDIDLLMFSGRTTELLELMVEVAPTIVASHKIMPHGIDEFFSILTFLLILQFIEQNDLNEENTPKLLSRLEELEIGFEEEVVNQTISRLSGQLRTKWKPDGFDETIQRKKREKNFFDLSVDFLVYLHTEHNIPFSQCELARSGIVDCLLKQTRLKKRKDEASILYPRERELDKHLSSYLDLFAPRPSRLVAVVAHLPYYVLFLAENKLVHWHHVKRVVSDVERLKISILKYFDNHALGNYYIPIINNTWDLANQLIHEKVLYNE